MAKSHYHTVSTLELLCKAVMVLLKCVLCWFLCTSYVSKLILFQRECGLLLQCYHCVWFVVLITCLLQLQQWLSLRQGFLFLYLVLVVYEWKPVKQFLYSFILYKQYYVELTLWSVWEVFKYIHTSAVRINCMALFKLDNFFQSFCIFYFLMPYKFI